MKKIALAALLASGLMAADSGMYMGMELGKTVGHIKWSSQDSAAPANNESGKDSDDGVGAALKVGYYLNENNRAYASIAMANMDNSESKSYGVGYDYLIGSGAFKPFVGVLAGYNKIELDGELSVFDISGAYYGAQVGVGYAVNDKLSVEAGYSYMKSNSSDTLTVGTDESIELELDYATRLYAGVNYKF